MGDCFMLVLVENDIVLENLQDLLLISNGFQKPITVTDFPVRDHTMYFRIKRRRWFYMSTGKSYSRDWNLEASGTRITAEFGAFLKELPWYSCYEYQECCRVYAFEGKCPKWLLQEPSERISLMESEKHSDEFTLYACNLGEHLAIDESSLSNGELYTIVTNKEGHGRKGTLVAMVKGVKSDFIISISPLQRKVLTH